MGETGKSSACTKDSKQMLHVVISIAAEDDGGGPPVEYDHTHTQSWFVLRTRTEIIDHVL